VCSPDLRGSGSAGRVALRAATPLALTSGAVVTGGAEDGSKCRPGGARECPDRFSNAPKSKPAPQVASEPGLFTSRLPSATQAQPSAGHSPAG